MLKISTTTPVWPPVQEVLRASNKDDVMYELERIARQMGHPFPTTWLLATDPKESDIPEDAVLKRTGSECGHHVILPECAIEKDDKLREEKLTKIRECRKPDSLKENAQWGLRWVCQQFILTLLLLGEYRFFIMDNHIIYTIHTWLTKDEQGEDAWDACEIHDFLPLNQIT